MVTSEAYWIPRLKAMPTRLLLTLRPYCGYYSYDTDEDPPLELLYAELNTRPHVPNKRESRGLRIQKLRERRKRTKRKLGYRRCE